VLLEFIFKFTKEFLSVKDMYVRKITGFTQVTHPYLLRYVVGKAFNKNSKFYKLSYARYRSNVVRR
ncbi:hypothetical protein CC80DRAFT_432452, partial [Byssothecium circinans]